MGGKQKQGKRIRKRSLYDKPNQKMSVPGQPPITSSIIEYSNERQKKIRQEEEESAWKTTGERTKHRDPTTGRIQGYGSEGHHSMGREATYAKVPRLGESERNESPGISLSPQDTRTGASNAWTSTMHMDTVSAKNARARSKSRPPEVDSSRRGENATIYDPTDGQPKLLKHSPIASNEFVNGEEMGNGGNKRNPSGTSKQMAVNTKWPSSEDHSPAAPVILPSIPQNHPPRYNWRERPQTRSATQEERQRTGEHQSTNHGHLYSMPVEEPISRMNTNQHPTTNTLHADANLSLNNNSIRKPKVIEEPTADIRRVLHENRTGDTKGAICEDPHCTQGHRSRRGEHTSKRSKRARSVVGGRLESGGIPRLSSKSSSSSTAPFVDHEKMSMEERIAAFDPVRSEMAPESVRRSPRAKSVADVIRNEERLSATQLASMKAESEQRQQKNKVHGEEKKMDKQVKEADVNYNGTSRSGREMATSSPSQKSTSSRSSHSSEGKPRDVLTLDYSIDTRHQRVPSEHHPRREDSARGSSSCKMEPQGKRTADGRPLMSTPELSDSNSVVSRTVSTEVSITLATNNIKQVVEAAHNPRLSDTRQKTEERKRAFLAAPKGYNTLDVCPDAYEEFIKSFPTPSVPPFACHESVKETQNNIGGLSFTFSNSSSPGEEATGTSDVANANHTPTTPLNTTYVVDGRDYGSQEDAIGASQRTADDDWESFDRHRKGKDYPASQQRDYSYKKEEEKKERMVKCLLGVDNVDYVLVSPDLLSPLSLSLKKRMTKATVNFSDYNREQFQILLRFAKNEALVRFDVPSAVTYLRFMRDFNIDFGSRFFEELEKFVQEDNVLLVYGETYGTECHRARKICEKVINRNGKNVLDQLSEFKRLPVELVETILNTDSLRSNCASHLFIAIVAWIEENSGKKSKSSRYTLSYSTYELQTLLTFGNVLHLFKQAWRFDGARNICENFICNNPQTVLSYSDEFRKLEPQQVASILRIPALRPRYMELFRAVIDWMKADNFGVEKNLRFDRDFGGGILDALEELLTVDNVLILYGVEKAWRFDALIQRFDKFIGVNAASVLKKTRQFNELNKEQILSIVKIDGVRSRKLDLFRVMIGWAETENGQRAFSIPSIKESIDNLIFSLLSVEFVLFLYSESWNRRVACDICEEFIEKNASLVLRQMDQFSRLTYEQIHKILTLIPRCDDDSAYNIDLFDAIVGWIEAEPDRTRTTRGRGTTYNVDALDESVQRLVSLDTVFACYELAKDCICAKEICEAFLVNNMDEIFSKERRERFTELSSDQVASLLNLEPYRLMDVQVFTVVVQWMKAEERRQMKDNCSFVDYGHSFYESFDKFISVDNALRLYVIGWECEDAREMCEEFIRREAGPILANREQFSGLDAEQVRAILGMDVLCAREFDVFRAVAAWIEAEEKRQKKARRANSRYKFCLEDKRDWLKSSEQKEEDWGNDYQSMGPFEDIRFTSMTLREFMAPDGPRNSDLLTDKEKKELMGLFTRNAPLNMIPSFQSTPRWGSPDGMEIEMVTETTAWKGARLGARYALQICSNKDIRFPCRIGFTCPANTHGLVVNYSIWRGSCIEMKRTHLEYNGEDEPLSAIADSAYMMHLQANVQYMIMAQFSQQVPMGNIRERKYTLKHPLYSDATVTVSPPSAEMVDMFSFEDASQMGPITKLWFCR